jgi:hypothetical protein
VVFAFQGFSMPLTQPTLLPSRPCCGLARNMPVASYNACFFAG